MLRPWTIDFETGPIRNRPRHPPEPCGVSIQSPEERRSKYWAWGHPTENNCTKREAMRVLRDAWKSGEPLLFHNAKFDVDVAQVWMECGDISWDRIHDTMFLVFLAEPHAATFSLKPSAERILGMAPTERDAVMDWLFDHEEDLKASGHLPIDVKLSKSQAAKDSPSGEPQFWAAWIGLAPGALVGHYADGDVKRTLRLFNKLHPAIRKAGMLEAYDRERQLLPILLENEREGLRCDLAGLERDEAEFTKVLTRVDGWLGKRLGVKGLDFNSDEDVADALFNSGVVTDFVLTEKSKKRSVSKDNLTVDLFKDQQVAQAFLYRNKLNTCLSTFFRSWINLAGADGGLLHPNWNQVRQARGRGNAGTRTGRPSMHNPNFLNVPKNFTDKNDGYVHPAFLRVPELPLMRRYILPDKGQQFGHRDYNQQELRILAHFEDADLMAAYLANPKMDAHTFIQEEIKRIRGLSLERRAVKILNFGMLYGMGLEALANDLGCSTDEAKEVKSAQRSIMPSVVSLERQIRRLGDDGDYITTWGGRRYYAEPPKVIDGRTRTFSYKLLNYLIQGSAADCTKQAIINYHERRKEGRFLVSVYDENNFSCPAKAMKEEMKIMSGAMADVAFDVPMLSDGKAGPNWADLKKVS